MLLGTIKKALINSSILRFFAKWHSKYRTKITNRSQNQQIGFENQNHGIRGENMNELAIPLGTEPREILQALIEKKTPAIMSYLSRRKWHVAKVLLTDLGANRLSIQVLPRKNLNPLNIQIDQPVGVSLKCGYGKIIFETTVIALEPSPEATSGGTIVLKVPDRIELVQRRNYFRVDVPKSLKVNVLLWHRSISDAGQQTPPEHYWQGNLADISAGGAQIVIDNAQNPDFKKGQFVGLRFTPMPYEMPLMFDAQIRNLLPTANDKSICLGLQIVGLEASSEGRQTLQRLCNVVEQYYRINQTNAKQQDFQTTKLITKRSG